MKYSLLSQFQGALLGAILGDFIGKELSIVAPSNRERNNLGSSKQKSFQDLDKNRARSGEIAIISALSLIRCEGLELEDWQENWKKWQSTKAPSELESNKIEKTPSREWEEPTAWETAIASVPVAMLYHEEEAKLRGKLGQIAEVWQGNLDVKLTNLAIGYAIALGLKEKLDPETTIPKTISYLKEDGLLVELLKEVQKALEKRWDLETAITNLSKKAKAMEENSSEAIANPTASLISIALAFYCFLSTPENWQLAVLRAGRTGRGSQICALVGAISGAYNSSAGIPVEWRRALDARLEKTPAMAELAAREAEIIKLAKSLWAVWCGVYNPETMENKLNLVPAVAASNVIGLR